MSFIGEDLSLKQVAVLQAVADGCTGYQFVKVSKIPEIIRGTNRCRAAEDANTGEIEQILTELEKEGLVEFENSPKHGWLVGLTDDGKRCNRIIVDLL